MFGKKNLKWEEKFWSLIIIIKFLEISLIKNLKEKFTNENYFSNRLCGFYWKLIHKEYYKKNIKIIGIDDLSAGYFKSLPKNKNFKFIKGDCANKNVLNKIKSKIDIIIHLAGQSSGERSFITL